MGSERGRKWFWFQVTLNKSLSLGSKKGVIWKLPWYFMKFVNILFCTTGQKSKLVTAKSLLNLYLTSAKHKDFQLFWSCLILKLFFFFSLECSTLRFQSTCMRVLEMLSQILTDFFFALSNQTKFKIKHEENEETLIFNFLLFKLIMQFNVSTKKYSALNNLELRHMDVIYKNSSEI